jgi:hypothetical protein
MGWLTLLLAHSLIAVLVQAVAASSGNVSAILWRCLLQVSAEALQQLKHSQSQLGSRVARHLEDAAQQQQQLLQQVEKQQEQLHVLEHQVFLQKRQQLMQELQGPPVDQDGSSSSSSLLEAPPDPWAKNGCTSSFNIKEQYVGERSSMDSSSGKGNGRGSSNAAPARAG